MQGQVSFLKSLNRFSSIVTILVVVGQSISLNLPVPGIQWWFQGSRGVSIKVKAVIWRVLWQLEPVRESPSYFKEIWAKLRPSLMLSSLFQTVTDGSESPSSTVSEHKYLQQYLQHATDWFLTINYKCRSLHDCQSSGFLFLDNSKMWKILTQEVLKARGGFHWRADFALGRPCPETFLILSKHCKSFVSCVHLQSTYKLPALLSSQMSVVP